MSGSLEANAVEFLASHATPITYSGLLSFSFLVENYSKSGNFPIEI